MNDHLPFTARGRERRAHRRDVDRAWDAAEGQRDWDDHGQRPAWEGARRHDGNAAADGFGAYAEDAPSAAVPRLHADWRDEQDFRQSQKTARRRPKRRLPGTLLAVITILSLLVGFLASQGLLRGVDLLAAALDAKTQATALEAIAKSGQYFSPATLDEVQQRLQALDADVLRIQSDVPASALGSRGGELTAAFTMATDLIRAGEYGVDAGQILVPHIKGMMSGLDGTSATSAAPPLTVSDAQLVLGDIDNAGVLAQAAIQQSQQIRPSDLEKLHLGVVVSLLDKMNAIAPKLPKYLYYAQLGLSALPSLLGLTAPAHYLLFDQDSDELRPTGGFLGNYALVSFTGGKLVGGVHLQDIYGLDCNGVFPGGCPNVLMPSQYAWMDAGGDQWFGVRDSNLDPNFPTSAGFIEQNFAYENQFHHRSAVPINGVIAFTPAFIGQVLDVIGGLYVPGYNIKVTSANLQEEIHYYHILYAYCNNANFASDPRCHTTVSVNKSLLSDKKAFDATLGATLMHAIATEPASVQGKIVKVALDALQTRDLQLYFNDPQVEKILSIFHVPAGIPAVQGDQLLVVDSNVGANYANHDLQEQVNDTVTLNPDGSATHLMTITYAYPYVKHLYSPMYAPTTLTWAYYGVLQVMVPPSATLLGYTWTCNAINTVEAGRNVWSCKPIYVPCNACNYDGTSNGQQPDVLTVRFRWVVPNAVRTVGGQPEYSLTVVHEAGTHNSYTVTVIGPNGKALTPLAGDPALSKANGGLTWHDTLLQDTTLAFGA